jgi:hypothetical protein
MTHREHKKYYNSHNESSDFISICRSNMVCFCCSWLQVIDNNWLLWLRIVVLFICIKCYVWWQKTFEETKVIIRNVNGRTDNKTAKGKERKRPTMIFKTLRRKLKIEQHVKELKCSGRVNSYFSTGDHITTTDRNKSHLTHRKHNEYYDR